jgi:hypothetical protein
MPPLDASVFPRGTAKKPPSRMQDPSALNWATPTHAWRGQWRQLP